MDPTDQFKLFPTPSGLAGQASVVMLRKSFVIWADLITTIII